MTLANPFTNSRRSSVTEADVDTDGNGDVTITVTELRQIESAADAQASAAGGYVANVQSVDGNSVTVRIFEDAGAAGALSASTEGTDLTDVHVSAVGY